MRLRHQIKHQIKSLSCNFYIIFCLWKVSSHYIFKDKTDAMNHIIMQRAIWFILIKNTNTENNWWWQIRWHRWSTLFVSFHLRLYSKYQYKIFLNINEMYNSYKFFWIYSRNSTFYFAIFYIMYQKLFIEVEFKNIRS